MGESEQKKITLFISYLAKDADIADYIEDKLKDKLQDQLQISRYTQTKYKDSFKAFMDSIQEHDFVLAIVSDGYLKSKACMYETGKVVSEVNYCNKLLFVILSEDERRLYKNPDKAPKKIAPSIYSDEGKLAYVEYWQKEAKKLNERISMIKSRTATAKLVNRDLVVKQHIADYDIDTFTDFLSDANGLTFKELEKKGFEDIILLMKPDYKNNPFYNCNDLPILLKQGLISLRSITKNDYNQIILGARIDAHSSGLVVVADDIEGQERSYRRVTMDGVITKAYYTGKSINVADTNDNDQPYFGAISETQSELAIPIMLQKNVIGVINSESEQNGYYTEDMVNDIKYTMNLFASKLHELGYVGTVREKTLPYVKRFPDGNFYSMRYIDSSNDNVECKRI